MADEEQQQQQDRQGSLQSEGSEDKRPVHSHRRSASSSAPRKPPLHRNNACLACRKKKRKCDAKHPVCTPCMNSAKLYQEEPQCEWGSGARSDDGSGSSSQFSVKREAKHEDAVPSSHDHQQQALMSSSSSGPPFSLGNLPPLSIPSLGTAIQGDPSSLPFASYGPTYFPGTGILTDSTGTSQDTGLNNDLPDADIGIGSSGRKRKNLKRDNNTAEVDVLQARIAELEAKLQAAQAGLLATTSGLGGGAAGGDAFPLSASTVSSASVAGQAQHVHFPKQLPHLHTQSMSAPPTNGSAGPGSTASSIEVPPKSSSTSGHGTASVSPFSSNGLPTPPPTSVSGIGMGASIYPSSPGTGSNASQGASAGTGSTGNSQDSLLREIQAQVQQGQKATSYFTRAHAGQQHDQKWSMAGLPGYLQTSPIGSGSQSPYGPGGLLWTQWPPDLPQIDIVKALAGTALAMISDTLFLLPADAVFRSLALPPTDPRFPSTALLHALCALGATSFPLPPEARGYWQEAPSASTYHFRQAKKHLQTFNAAQVLDDLRAAILLVIYSFAAEQFIDVWQLVGMSCRGLPATGLNHVQNHSALPSTVMGTTPGHFLRKPTYLAPAVDDYEVFYRSTTMWMAFSSDVWMGACSGWAMAIDLADITTLLPVWPSDTTPLDVVLNQPSLDPHSQLFFTSHLDSPMISLHLSIKAMVLLRRVVDFLQRSTAPDSIINMEAKRLVRASPAFVSLTETIAGFQQNFPDKAKYHLQTLPSGKLDSNLLNAHIIPCTALMLLYEPFIYNGDDEEFHSSSMAAANRILQITQSVYNHSKDAISMYYTQINYSWMVCNRTLIRAMRFKEDAGDQEGARSLRTNVEFLLARNSTLAAQSPLVYSCLGMIENLVKDETPWHRQ